MNIFKQTIRPDHFPTQDRPPVTLPSPRKLSEQAGEIVHHVNELEQLVADLQRQNDSLRVDIRALQSIQDDLTRELTHIRNERDFYQRREIAMSTQLRTVGKIVVETLRVAEEAPPSIPAVEEDIRHEVHANLPRPDQRNREERRLAVPTPDPDGHAS